MAHMDVFESDVFSMVEMTARLMDMRYRPRRIGDLGLFDEQGIATTSLSIERQQNTLKLVPTTPRGGPATQRTKDQRLFHQVGSVRLAYEDAVLADEIQNLRAFGTEDVLQTVEAEVDKRMMNLSEDIEATLEYHRVQALHGLVLDADGSTLYDMADIFGVTIPTEQAWDIGSGGANAAAGLLRPLVSAVIRGIEDELGGLPYTSIMGMCGSNFFDTLTSHAEYRENKLNWENARQLDDRIARRRVDFGGITFEEYRGSVGGTSYVDTDKCRFFPMGVPDFAITRFAPAEYVDTVNTVGLPRYVLPVDAGMGGLSPKVGRTFRIQSHPITLITRPGTLFSARHTT